MVESLCAITNAVVFFNRGCIASWINCSFRLSKDDVALKGTELDHRIWWMYLIQNQNLWIGKKSTSNCNSLFFSTWQSIGSEQQVGVEWRKWTWIPHCQLQCSKSQEVPWWNHRCWQPYRPVLFLDQLHHVWQEECCSLWCHQTKWCPFTVVSTKITWRKETWGTMLIIFGKQLTLMSLRSTPSIVIDPLETS